MSDKIVILGAGMAGLLAANMMRHRNPVVMEIKGELPHNHGALLRFRSNSVSAATGVPFKKVNVSKAIYHNGDVLSSPNILVCNKYSQRVSGKVTNRSISNLNDETRYIAPDNFIECAARGVEIRYGINLTTDDFTDIALSSGNPIISTIPMPALMQKLDYPDRDNSKFDYSPVVSYRLTIDNVDAYQTVYIPDPVDSHFYRVSITGHVIIFETTRDDLDMKEVISGMQDILFKGFGIYGWVIAPEYIEKVHQKYGKLISGNRKYARRFISWATTERNVYSLGRFSTWKQILMDDCVRDINVIDNLIETENYRG